MLAADHRLRDSEAFRRTVRSGRRAGGAALVVHVFSRPEAEAGSVARLGLVVSKAVGNAVTRNRVKRRLRHVVRPHLAALPASSDLVVRAQPAAAGLTSAELDAELARCLERAGRATVSRTGS
ncbi:ribonuclease P protein component [Nocardioides halotolerans]|uniref:ribonuclease P protein component n=1 Tax=Nocardioides halotolerans TaxID=433660 RepID=UPI0003F9086A|nr:ribonuclease P protein component [Nocardioides halotolerans]